MTTQEIIALLTNAITASETDYANQLSLLNTQITSLNAEIADLKTKVPPTGLVKIVIVDVDMAKVTFS